MLFERSFKLFLLLFQLDKHTSLSFPLDSFIYEANPIQKLTFQYSNSTKPLKFKLQTVSFKIYEQLPGLYSDDITTLSSDEKTNNDDAQKYDDSNLKYDLKQRDIENKYKQLSRFTVFYDTVEDKNKSNDTNHGPLHKNATGFTRAAEIIKESEAKPSVINSYGITDMELISSTTENDPRYLETTTDNILSTDTVELTTTEMAHQLYRITEINPETTTEPDYITEFGTTEIIDDTSTIENSTFESLHREIGPTSTDPYEESTSSVIAENADKSATNSIATTKLTTQSFKSTTSK